MPLDIGRTLEKQIFQGFRMRRSHDHQVDDGSRSAGAGTVTRAMRTGCGNGLLMLGISLCLAS